jgi:hypothetical protein
LDVFFMLWPTRWTIPPPPPLPQRPLTFSQRLASPTSSVTTVNNQARQPSGGAPAGPAPGSSPPIMSFTEQRTHFGLWAILSSPLTLSLDLRNATIVDAAWPIISNVDAIAVNQAWEGYPGGVYAASNETVVLEHCDPNWAGDHK